jgi:hypothetical protein
MVWTERGFGPRRENVTEHEVFKFLIRLISIRTALTADISGCFISLRFSRV